MSATAFVRAVEERPDPLKVVGECITVLASRHETEGYEIFLQEGTEGTGPPPHHHEWDESFFVIDGTVQFGMGDEELTARRGTLVHLPSGTVHWFRFGTGGGTMLSLTGKGSNAAAFFNALDAEIPDGSVDVKTIGRVADQHGVHFG